MAHRTSKRAQDLQEQAATRQDIAASEAAIADGVAAGKRYLRWRCTLCDTIGHVEWCSTDSGEPDQAATHTQTLLAMQLHQRDCRTYQDRFAPVEIVS